MPHQSTSPTVLCAHCGKAFVGKTYRASRFCSLACYTGRKITLTCRQCGAAFHRKASNAPKARYCSYACSDLAKSGDVTVRFWSKVDKSAGPDGCWLWTASLTRGGYGRYNDHGAAISAHRWAYEAAYGPLTDDVLVQHSCDTRRCVNPAHLFPGTPATNTTDMVLKGRNVRGERCHTAKLTDDQVVAIRRRYHAGGVSQTQLAAEYGVRARLIGRVVRRESWQHLP